MLAILTFEMKIGTFWGTFSLISVQSWTTSDIAEWNAELQRQQQHTCIDAFKLGLTV